MNQSETNLEAQNSILYESPKALFTVRNMIIGVTIFLLAVGSAVTYTYQDNIFGTTAGVVPRGNNKSPARKELNAPFININIKPPVSNEGDKVLSDEEVPAPGSVIDPLAEEGPAPGSIIDPLAEEGPAPGSVIDPLAEEGPAPGSVIDPLAEEVPAPKSENKPTGSAEQSTNTENGTNTLEDEESLSESDVEEEEEESGSDDDSDNAHSFDTRTSTTGTSTSGILNVATSTTDIPFTGKSTNTFNDKFTQTSTTLPPPKGPTSSTSVQNNRFALKLVLPAENPKIFAVNVAAILARNKVSIKTQFVEEKKILNLIFVKSAKWAKAWVVLNHFLKNEFVMARGLQTFFKQNSQNEFEIMRKNDKKGRIRDSITFKTDIPAMTLANVFEVNYRGIKCETVLFE